MLGIINQSMNWILELLSDPVGFLSVLFSGILVILYFRQSTLMSKQTEIHESQQKLMDIEQRPIVQVDGFREGTEQRGGVESLELKISNLGGSPITDLRLKIATGFHEDTPFNGGCTTTDLHRANFRAELETELSGNPRWKKSRRDYIESHERGAEFVTYDIPIRWSHETEERGGTLSLFHLRTELSNYKKPKTLELKIFIQYKNHKLETQEEKIFDYIVPLCDENSDDYISMGPILHESREVFSKNSADSEIDS